MHCTSELGKTFSKTTFIMGIIGLCASVGIYYFQKKANEKYAQTILEAVFEEANSTRSQFKTQDLSDEEEETATHHMVKIEREGWNFSVTDDSTPSLIKVETGEKEISEGICHALNRTLKKGVWKNIIAKAYILDRFGNEKEDITMFDCPDEEVPMMRFYVSLVTPQQEEEKNEEEQTFVAPPEKKSYPTSSPTPVAPASVSTPRTTTSTYTSSSCPFGTSITGAGGWATSGCKCNNSGETWNGKNCQRPQCPQGSSLNATGDKTNVANCRCNANTPVWSQGHCIEKCIGDKVYQGSKCVCPHNLVSKRGDPNLCVECNETSDCYAGYKCIANYCTDKEEANDCRWGICQTCDENKSRKNLLDNESCETAGLAGICNNNGTCYPTKGRRCSSINGCPSGQFCNFGGIFNGSKRQKGKFGQTPNVCQKTLAKEFVHKKITYYFNTEKDLKSWCRAANNKPNCLWGYLAKSGAQSWCKSLGKRLLTKKEMADVWKVLRKELPQTYKGYAYWIQEGVWLENKEGRLSFSKGHPDGYGGRGGVVCR